MGGEITTVQQDEKAMMGLLKEMYGKNLSDLEFKTLIYMARKYDLDPVQHEIWALKYGNNAATIMTGRDGFLAIAHKSGQFDGMETLAIMRDGSEVATCLDAKELAGAICRVWRKDMAHPIVVAVPLHEYNTGKSNWAKMPETMIKKVAESQSLRRAFNISGMYSPEEMDQAEYLPQKTETPKQEAPKEKPVEDPMLEELPEKKRLEILSSTDSLFNQLAHEAETSVETVKLELLQEFFGVESRKQLRYSQCRELYSKLKQRLIEVQNATV